MGDKYIKAKDVAARRDTLLLKCENWKQSASKKGNNYDYSLGVSGEAELCASQLTSLIDSATERDIEEIQCARCNKILPRIIKLNPGGAVDTAYCQECFDAVNLTADNHTLKAEVAALADGLAGREAEVTMLAEANRRLNEDYDSLKATNTAMRVTADAYKNTHTKLTAQRDELVGVLRKCYAELNEIHARDGVPYTHMGIKASVVQEYFTSVVEEARAALAKVDGGE